MLYVTNIYFKFHFYFTCIVSKYIYVYVYTSLSSFAFPFLFIDYKVGDWFITDMELEAWRWWWQRNIIQCLATLLRFSQRWSLVRDIMKRESLGNRGSDKVVYTMRGSLGESHSWVRCLALVLSASMSYGIFAEARWCAVHHRVAVFLVSTEKNHSCVDLAPLRVGLTMRQWGDDQLRNGVWLDPNAATGSGAAELNFL